MKPIFRNSMFGFHKEDVCNFISRQSRNYEERIKELTEENNRITCELENEKNNSLSYEKKAKILSDVESEVFSLASSIEEVLHCGELCDMQNKEIKTAFMNMEEELEKAEAFREKAKKFDRLSGVLSSIFANKEDAEENLSPDSEIVCTAVKNSFPENDGIDRLRDAILTLKKHCEVLNELILESKTDE